MWLLIIFTAALAAVIGFKVFAKKAFGKGRELQSLDEIHNSVQDEVSAEALKEVWLKVGELFSINPQLIRPTDKLKRFTDMDSWDMGSGVDALESWIEKKQLEHRPSLETMLDLAKWVDTKSKS